MNPQPSVELDSTPRVRARAEVWSARPTLTARTVVFALSVLGNAILLWAIGSTTVTAPSRRSVVFAAIQLDPSRVPELLRDETLAAKKPLAAQAAVSRKPLAMKGAAIPESKPSSAPEAVTPEAITVAGAEATPKPDRPDAEPIDFREQSKRVAKEMAREIDPRDRQQQDRVAAGSIARLGENVEAAARQNCATQYSGAGLLAPLWWLIDSKPGVGCKWGG